MDLISKYTDLVSEYTDAPEIFIKASSYHLVSSLLGRFFYIPSAKGQPKPNVWLLLSSIPGRFRRSTVQYLHNRVYRGALKQFRIETEDESPGTADSFADESVIEQGSPEGITDHIENSETDCFSIMSHEFGTILNKITGPTYQAGVEQIFSKLYYGQGGVTYLSKRGGSSGQRYIPRNRYVTMLAGMQEPDRYIDRTFLEQGLLRRIMICYLKTSEDRIKKWKPILDIPSARAYRKIEDFIDPMLGKMKKYRKERTKYEKLSGLKAYIPIEFAPQAERDINNYAKSVEDEVLRIQNNRTLYRQSDGEKLVKLSAVKAISRGELVDIEGKKHLNVRGNDVDEGIEFLESASEDFLRVLPELGMKKARAVSIREPAEKIWDTIEKHGSCITSTKLLQSTNMSKGSVMNNAITLLERGQIIVGVYNIPGRTRKMVIFANNERKLDEVTESLEAVSPGETDDLGKATVIAVKGDNAELLREYW